MSVSIEKKSIIVRDLGTITWRDAYRVQQQACEQVIKGAPPMLFFCEHPPVFTIGRAGCEKNVLCAKEELVDRGMTIEKIDRGGDITLHSPGQLVIYPIINIRNCDMKLSAYLYCLEQVAIDFLRYFGIVASRRSGYTGAWVGEEKIASIGIGMRKWVSFHGMAINISIDLEYFKLIRPCGLDVTMTSVLALTGHAPDMNAAKTTLRESFERVFECASITGEEYNGGC